MHESDVVGPGYLPDIRSTLLWVGDIDNDGIPDLLMNASSRSGAFEKYSPYESGYDVQLCLSSQITDSSTWTPSAKFEWWDEENSGC